MKDFNELINFVASIQKSNPFLLERIAHEFDRRDGQRRLARRDNADRRDSVKRTPAV